MITNRDKKTRTRKVLKYVYQRREVVGSGDRAKKETQLKKEKQRKITKSDNFVKDDGRGRVIKQWPT